MVALGNADAAAAIKLGVGKSFHNFLEQAEQQDLIDNDVVPTAENLKKYKAARLSRVEAHMQYTEI